ncbi:tRNA (N(6)-L-threonylcarbamoyladenosine(37)-C(2))-methylthiotransferase MtaB [bacterium]|nr:tRNA (N(6)-L-threonylcarbamoyladenosine(37)-C(2))-methylthiotransferase MtaB [bacterium]
MSEESTRTLRIAFQTLGCRLNHYDTEVMKARLPGGLRCETVPWDQDADVYVLNSCTVTLKADQKCRQLARAVKRRRPGAKVVVTGCYAQTQQEALAAIPELDGVFGLNEREDIADWLPRLLAAEAPLVEVGDFAKDAPFRSHDIAEFDGRTRAFVKVQDGCDLRCSYCLIWKARGPGRSRPVAEVCRQIGILRGSGFGEIVLAGVHLGGYGRDLGRGQALTALLETVLDRFPDLRFRLSSIHPNEVREPLLELFTKHANLRPYLHISLQSGSDTVLKRMRRPYDVARAGHAIEAAAALSPHFGIGADVIVGFPGESGAEFAETRSFVASSPLSYLHVFRYSPRPGTPAALLRAVHTETVTERSRIMRDLSRRKRRDFEARLVGHWHEAVVETDRPAPGRLQATTGNYATVSVPDTWATGDLVRLKPAGFRDDVLYADEVAPADGS